MFPVSQYPATLNALETAETEPTVALNVYPTPPRLIVMNVKNDVAR